MALQPIARQPLQRRAAGPLRVGRWLIWFALLAGLGLILARAPLSVATLLVLGATGCLLLLRFPVLGLCALAFAVPFGSLRSMSVGGIHVTLAHPILFATACAWIARNMALRRAPARRSPVFPAVMALIAVCSLSLLKARDLSAAATELMKWVEFALLLVLVPDVVGTRASRWLVAALLIAGAAQGLLGIYQFLYQVGPPGFVLLGRYMRAHGTFEQPNPYGGYLGMLIPLAAAMVLTRWRKVPGESVSLWGERLLWVLALGSLVVMTAGLAMSWSRGALLGVLAGLALMLVALARRAWPVLLALAIGCLLLYPFWQPFVPMDYVSRLEDTTTYLGQDLSLIEIDDANFAVIERLAHWQAAWRMFSSSPWIGVGVGQYPSAYPAFAVARWQDPLGHAHNYYLHTLAETGLVGFAAYVCFLLAALRTAWRGARNEAGWRRVLALGALGMVGHVLTHSLVDNLYVHDMYLQIALLLGMLSSGTSIRAREPKTWTGTNP